jgi:putative heme iron utilization protein
MIDETVKHDSEKVLESELRKYGITRVPVDYFYIHGFRYTEFKDAVAQAQRMKTMKGSR